MRRTQYSFFLFCSLSFSSACHTSATVDDGQGLVPFDAGVAPALADPDAQSSKPVDAMSESPPIARDASPLTPSDAGARDAQQVTDAAGDASGLDAGAAMDASPDGAQPDATALDAAMLDGATQDAMVDASLADARAPDAGPEPYPVGTTRIEISADAGRTIPVQLWYPAAEAARAEAAQGHPTTEFEPAGSRRDQLTTMLANSPEGCTSKTMHAAHTPAVGGQGAQLPALVFSHCQDCVRFSLFTVFEHLASLGFVVAAPDHINGTIYDGTGLLDEAFLQVRANDVRRVIDVLLDAQASVLPAGLRGRIDATRIGAFGHSYGSLTTGRVMRDDTRVKAGVMLAAPIDLGSPLDLVLPSAVDVTTLKQPGLFFEALKDTALLNVFIEDNFERYPRSSWLLQLKDAGHWSFTDIAGFNGTFTDGCGADFVEIAKARTITKAYVAAFFEAELRGNRQAQDYLGTATPPDLVTLKHRP